MSLKVLGILGSPCQNGIAAELLDAALRGAEERGADVERLDLPKMQIHPCIECRECDSAASCVQHRDDMAVIYRKIREVDGIALSSPIFFMGVTAQTKAMIDRCQCFWIERYVMKTRAYEGRRRPKGVFLSCAGSPKPIVFEPAIHTAKAFFAAIDYEYTGEVLLGHTDDPGLAPRKAVAIESAKAAGRKLCD
ncbi:MAG: flavodoxin family protein [Thermoplasmata archaeon]|nr:flavodoxin family protein [Thermoplasmata archaeon]